MDGNRADDRASTGIRGLDDILEGGFPANRCILLSGEPGTGKSIFGLQFLAAGIAVGQPGVCVSVDQKPQHLLNDASRFGWNLDAAVSVGMLTVLDASPYFTATRNKTKNAVPIDARSIATDLSNQVRRIGAKRLVIDSLTSLVPPDMSRSEAHDYLRSVVLSLEDNMGCTVLLTSRAGSPGDPQALCEAGSIWCRASSSLRYARRVGRLSARCSSRKCAARRSSRKSIRFKSTQKAASTCSNARVAWRHRRPDSDSASRDRRAAIRGFVMVGVIAMR
ncbi:MAG TPA: ATPase domain-containing protein [Vicinamibacterales bacterium]|nr:ATPase domain-containing protein [Vicinamibacterales bacterium]